MLPAACMPIIIQCLVDIVYLLSTSVYQVFLLLSISLSTNRLSAVYLLSTYCLHSVYLMCTQCQLLYKLLSTGAAKMLACLFQQEVCGLLAEASHTQNVLVSCVSCMLLL